MSWRTSGSPCSRYSINASPWRVRKINKPRLLLEAAKLQEERAEAKPAALSSRCRVLAMRPFDRALEADVARLANEVETPAVAAEAFEAAAEQVGGDADRKAQLLTSAAKLYEDTGDASRALAAYAQALRAMPRSVTLADAVVRVGAAASEAGDEGAAAAVLDVLRAVNEGEPPTEHLRHLAAALESAPGEELYRTLSRIAEREPGELGSLARGGEGRGREYGRRERRADDLRVGL